MKGGEERRKGRKEGGERKKFLFYRTLERIGIRAFSPSSQERMRLSVRDNFRLRRKRVALILLFSNVNWKKKISFRLATFSNIMGKISISRGAL